MPAPPPDLVIVPDIVVRAFTIIILTPSAYDGETSRCTVVEERPGQGWLLRVHDGQLFFARIEGDPRTLAAQTEAAGRLVRIDYYDDLSGMQRRRIEAAIAARAREDATRDVLLRTGRWARDASVGAA